MSLQIDVVTLFPQYFEGPLNESILKRAQSEHRLEMTVHDLRQFTHDKRRTVDDKPFGGGAGMLMKPEPLFECIETIQPQKKKTGKKSSIGRKGWVVLLDPHGDPLTQKLVQKLSSRKRLILIAGHYEGVDHRVREHLVDQEISVGDFITMGGEAPSLCLIEAVARFIPGVLGNKDSVKSESFQTNKLEYPQYTRPRDFRGWNVPDTLVSGNHRDVALWRREAAAKITRKRRPDLLKKGQA
jgi:tRNA (guanine37-N1)-methyltransferase